MNLNKVMVAGRLTRDPELKQLPNGNSVTNLGFVTNRVFKSGDEKKEEATFLDVKAWGASGETIAKYLEKGSPIFIEGRLTLETWESNGEKRSKLVVTLENYKFINDGSRKEKKEEPKKDDLGF
jgi:single-strand DNA-binding protein|tara:strand:+ start:160 stop:531 length:372 start_codon:yes stop_codon:yes gene_type:complete